MTSAEPVLSARAQRFPFRVPLQYRKSGDSNWHPCTTMNISRTGILFRAQEEIPPESVLDIQVNFPLQKVLYCHGTIVRSQKSSHAVRIYHCQLKNITNSTN